MTHACQLHVVCCFLVRRTHHSLGGVGKRWKCKQTLMCKATGWWFESYCTCVYFSSMFFQQCCYDSHSEDQPSTVWIDQNGTFLAHCCLITVLSLRFHKAWYDFHVVCSIREYQFKCRWNLLGCHRRLQQIQKAILRHYRLDQTRHTVIGS